MVRGDITEERDLVEDMFDDFEETVDEEEPRYRPSKRRRQGPPIFLVVIAIVVVLGLLVLFFRSEDRAASEDLGEIKSRLDRLEKTITRFEALQQSSDSFEGQIKALQQSVAKLEGTNRSLKERIEDINQKIEKVAKSSQTLTVRKIKTVQPVGQQKAPTQIKTRFHEVMPGESLFQIAKKYGITVDRLRQLNRLKENQSLTPGMKLVVN